MAKTLTIHGLCIVTLCVWQTVAALNHNDVTGPLSKTKIPFTKCCQDGEVYMVGLDTCQPKHKTKEKETDKMTVVPISRKNAEHRRVAEEDFNITVSLVDCPEGYVAVSTDKFTFHADGTLYSSTDDIDINPGQFCIEVSLPLGNLSARYCLRDHFLKSKKVRKCCPGNMGFDGEACQLTTKTFTPTFHFSNGTHVLPEETPPVQDSVTPHCSGKRTQLLLSDEYYLLPEDALYIRNTSRLLRNETGIQTEEYCVDLLIRASKEFNQVAVVCTAAKPESRLRPQRGTIKESDDVSHSFYPYFMFVSAFFLILTFFVYTLVPEMRNIHGVPVMCYVLCLAVCYIVNGVLHLVDTNITELCHVLAALMHFLYLSTYAWLNIVCFDIWWTLRKMRPTRGINQAIRRPALGKAFIFYSAYAWLVPATIVVVTQILDHLDGLPEYIIQPAFSNQTCWFSEVRSILAYVYEPVAVSVVIDIILVIMTAVQLHKAGFSLRRGANKENSRYGHRLMIIIGLFLLKMAAWITEFVLVLLGHLAGEIVYVVDSIEMAASILTFVIFACKSSVWELLTGRYCKCFRRGLPSSNSKDIILEMSSTPGNRRRQLVFSLSS